MTWRSLGFPEARKTWKGATLCWKVKSRESDPFSSLTNVPVREKRIKQPSWVFASFIVPCGLQSMLTRGIYSNRDTATGVETEFTCCHTAAGGRAPVQATAPLLGLAVADGCKVASDPAGLGYLDVRTKPQRPCGIPGKE